MNPQYLSSSLTRQPLIYWPQ